MSAPKITREMHERRRRIRSYKELMQECFSLRKSGAWISTVGKSTFGRNIILISIGDGRKRVLVICRQHGNEPTSMEAMLDYTQELLIGSKYKGLMKKVRLFLIPTANPDGAELYNYVCRKGKTSILTSYIARSIKPY